MISDGNDYLVRNYASNAVCPIVAAILLTHRYERILVGVKTIRLDLLYLILLL